MKDIVTYLHVFALAGAGRGRLVMGEQSFPCALGRCARQVLKREGDGATPVGCYHLERVYYRRDRGIRLRSALPLVSIRPDLGWCDQQGDRNYNRAVTLPYTSSHERMYRDDELYDIVVVTSHNRRPRVQGLGSAVFLHLARPDFNPTAGCIALDRRAMTSILSRCDKKTRLVIRSPGA